MVQIEQETGEGFQEDKKLIYFLAVVADLCAAFGNYFIMWHM